MAIKCDDCGRFTSAVRPWSASQWSTTQGDIYYVCERCRPDLFEDEGAVGCARGNHDACTGCDCMCHDTLSGRMATIERGVRELGIPGLLAELDQVKTDIAFRRDRELFGPS